MFGGVVCAEKEVLSCLLHSLEVLKKSERV